MVGHGALIAATPEEAVAKAAQTQSRLSKKKAKQLRRRVRNAIPRPWRFEPPRTKAAPPDRDMSKGIEGVISFGDVATGTGAFAKAAMKQGMRCDWWIEPNDKVAAVAKTVLGSTPKRYRSVEAVHPLDLPRVQALVAGPDCTPFSAAGKQRGFADKRSRTLLWLIWYAALQQPLFCLIENVSALQRVQKGDVFRTLVSLFDIAGFHLHHQHMCPTHLGIPETRKRMFMLVLRKDRHALWGVPRPFKPPDDVVHRTLESILQPPHEVRYLFDAHRAWEMQVGAVRQWKTGWHDKGSAATPGVPVCALTYGTGGFGYRAYVNATPAHKHSSFGPGGNSHLVVQETSPGVWQPRRMSEIEVKRKYDGVRCGMKHPVPANHPDAMAQLGNSSPMDMVDAIMQHYVSSFLRPQ